MPKSAHSAPHTTQIPVHNSFVSCVRNNEAAPWNVHSHLFPCYCFHMIAYIVLGVMSGDCCARCLYARVCVCVSVYVSVAMRGETIRASWTFSHKKSTVKGIPIIGHEGLRGCGCKGAHTYVYIAMALGKSRIASPRLGRHYPPVLIL